MGSLNENLSILKKKNTKFVNFMKIFLKHNKTVMYIYLNYEGNNGYSLHNLFL